MRKTWSVYTVADFRDGQQVFYVKKGKHYVATIEKIHSDQLPDGEVSEHVVLEYRDENGVEHFPDTTLDRILPIKPN